jgi:hypothetical protein
MADEIEYEGLSPNAGLGVRIFSPRAIRLGLLVMSFQVNMLAGALVSLVRNQDGADFACIARALGWNHRTRCDVSRRQHQGRSSLRRLEHSLPFSVV